MSEVWEYKSFSGGLVLQHFPALFPGTQSRKGGTREVGWCWMDYNVLPSLKLTWHLKMDGWKTSFLLGWPIFWGLCLISGVYWKRSGNNKGWHVCIKQCVFSRLQLCQNLLYKYMVHWRTLGTHTHTQERYSHGHPTSNDSRNRIISFFQR